MEGAHLLGPTTQRRVTMPSLKARLCSMGLKGFRCVNLGGYQFNDHLCLCLCLCSWHWQVPWTAGERGCRWRGKEDKRAIAHPLDRLLLPAPACWVSSTGSRVLQEGDDDTDPFLDLLLWLLTQQFASGVPIFSDFLKVGETSGRRDALKSIPNSPASPRGPRWLNAPNPFPALLWGQIGFILSALHTAEGSKFNAIFYI